MRWNILRGSTAAGALLAGLLWLGAPLALAQTPVVPGLNVPCGTGVGGLCFQPFSSTSPLVTSQPLTQTPVAAGTATATKGGLGACQYLATLPTLTDTQQVAVLCSTKGGQLVSNIDSAGNAVDYTQNVSIGPAPGGATQITASATGTTGATTATLAGTAGKTTYLCGFSIRANATAAATGTATVTGTVTGTLSFVQWTAPLASGIGVTEPSIGPYCIPASGVNVGIAVVSAAPGTGGTVSVSAWGFQL